MSPMMKASAVLVVLVSCASTEPVEECISDTLAGELGVEYAVCPGEIEVDGKADGAIDSPGLRFLRARSERELAKLFARGRADAIPSGRNNGTPLLLGLDWLAPAFSQIYVGSIWEPMPDGSIKLRDAWLRSGDGHLVTLFEANVMRGVLSDVTVPSRPHPLIPIYRDRLAFDGKPSLFVDYSADPTPVINRILDEIREVDPTNCPGLFLGRAHYQRPNNEWVYLYWFALDFGSRDRGCTLRVP